MVWFGFDFGFAVGSGVLLLVLWSCRRWVVVAMISEVLVLLDFGVWVLVVVYGVLIVVCGWLFTCVLIVVCGLLSCVSLFMLDF